MNIYIVKDILEADFGCEETGRKEPTALLELEDTETKEERSIEITEAEIAEKGISEGKKVIITDDGTVLKYVRVVAAVIRDNGKIFATARGYGEFKGWWEFPGGKIEKGETPEEALVREIKEELTATIKVEDLIYTIEYDYDTFHLSMDCFWAKIIEGELVLKEAESAKWLSKDELGSVKWLPADKELIEIIRKI